jgi:hypothetical protein
MSSAYAIRIWEDDKAYSNGWDMSLHSSPHKAMMRVLQYLLVDFNVQKYYDDEDDSTGNCHVSSVIDTVRDAFDNPYGRANFMFQINNRSAPFKTLLIDVRKVHIDK